MCLLTIIWHKSSLLIKKNWIDWAIEAQIVIFEEAEYYGVYDPNLFDTTFWMVSLKLIEIWSQILFEKIVFRIRKIGRVYSFRCLSGKD